MQEMSRCEKCGKQSHDSPCALCFEWPVVSCGNCREEFYCECLKARDVEAGEKKQQRQLNAFAKLGLTFFEFAPGKYRSIDDPTVEFTANGHWTLQAGRGKKSEKGTTAGRLKAALKSRGSACPVLCKYIVDKYELKEQIRALESDYLKNFGFSVFYSEAERERTLKATLANRGDNCELTDAFLAEWKDLRHRKNILDGEYLKFAGVDDWLGRNWQRFSGQDTGIAKYRGKT